MNQNKNRYLILEREFVNAELERYMFKYISHSEMQQDNLKYIEGVITSLCFVLDIDVEELSQELQRKRNDYLNMC